MVLEQTQTNSEIFVMPLDIVLTTASLETTVVVWDSLRTQTFEFLMDEDAVAVKVDPDGWVLKSLEQKVSVSSERTVPEDFSLRQNYPNPFNNSSTIRYSLPYDTVISLNIHDLQGRKIRTVVEGLGHAGHEVVTWDGRDDSGRAVASGIYFYRLLVGGRGERINPLVRKMIFLR